MTLFKLSVRNAKRQAQDYLVYFVTVMIAAALIYAFNGLAFSEEVTSLAQMMESLPVVIALASIVVVCIIGWMVQYTIRFMFSRRSREFGAYILTGLENRQVSRMFFLENLLVGGVALLLGVLAGNLLFQALRAILLALFHVPYTFDFSFSLTAVGLTVFYFSLIYLFALFRMNRRIRSMKICDLLFVDRQNEEALLPKSRSRVRIFFVSIVLGIVGTLLLSLRSFTTGVVGSACIILFLYGFFISFSSGVPAWFEKHTARKYQGNTVLLFRMLSARLATMGIVMATISLLLTATLLTEGAGMLFHVLIQDRIRETTCFDLFLSSEGSDLSRMDEYAAYVEANVPVRDSWEYHIYQGDGRQITDYLMAGGDYFSSFSYDTVMKASDYNALRKILGYSEVSMEEGRCLIHCMPYLEKRIRAYPEPFSIGGQTFLLDEIYTESFTQSLWGGNGRGFLLVVPDEAAASLPVGLRAFAVLTEGRMALTAYTGLCELRDQNALSGESYDTIFCRTAIESENVFLYASIVFPLFYLALALTMVSATILTIQQLSEAARYRRHFDLLCKLGMERREMARTLRAQFVLFYAMPAIPPLLIGITFIWTMGRAMDPGVLAGPEQLAGITGLIVGIFLLIYFLYIWLAYYNMKRTVLPE